MKLLYKIILVDPDFLPRLRKFCIEKGVGKKVFWYFLVAFSKHKGDEKPVLDWLKKERLISEEAYNVLVSEVRRDAERKKKEVFS